MPTKMPSQPARVLAACEARAERIRVRGGHRAVSDRGVEMRCRVAGSDTRDCGVECLGAVGGPDRVRLRVRDPTLGNHPVEAAEQSRRLLSEIFVHFASLSIRNVLINTMCIDPVGD